MIGKMIIEFPKRYTVKHIVGSIFHVHVPVEFVAQLAELIKAQPWVSFLSVEGEVGIVHCSKAYEYTQEEAHAALCKLAEYVMEPSVDVDRDVWNFDTQDGAQ